MLTNEQLKHLNTADFLAPNPVLCYGGGGAFESVAPYLIECAINVVGVIDVEKRGEREICGKTFSFLTIDAAFKRFGANAIIIITIANEKTIHKVHEELVRIGFQSEKIFDFNVWTYLTVPSQKSFCPHFNGYINFSIPGIANCCYGGVKKPYFCEWYVAGRAIQTSIDNFLNKQKWYLEQSKLHRIPIFCKDCAFLCSKIPDDAKFWKVCFSDNYICNAKCIYCDAVHEERNQSAIAAETRFEMYGQFLNQLCVTKSIDSHSMIVIASGEITINPYKRILYDALEKTSLPVRAYSNCIQFDPILAEIISQNEASCLQCDIDAGTAETYIKIKGVNRFHGVKNNLKEYLAHDCVIAIRYIVMPDWNDTDEDYNGMVCLLHELGVAEMILSPEYSSMNRDRMSIRKMIFSIARFTDLLDKNGICAIFLDTDWKPNYLEAVTRFVDELRKLETTI